MNDADKEAFKKWAVENAIRTDLGSWEAWKAALEWRDSQAGEPFAYFYHDADNAKEANPIVNSTLFVLACQRRAGFTNETPLYTATPAAQTARPKFVAEGYMVVVNGEKTYFKTYAEANSNCDGDQKPAILYDILQKPTQTG